MPYDEPGLQGFGFQPRWRDFMLSPEGRACRRRSIGPGCRRSGPLPRKLLALELLALLHARRFACSACSPGRQLTLIQ